MKELKRTEVKEVSAGIWQILLPIIVGTVALLRPTPTSKDPHEQNNPHNQPF